MKELTKIQRWLFIIGGALMVLGAGLYVFMWNQPIVCWVFLLGAVLFASMQIAQAYMGNSLVIKRLKNIMTLADLFFIIAGLLMVDNAYGLLRPMFHDITSYLTYVYNKWVVLLLIAAILEIYTMHRISSELEKE
ncbi:hypothetical protein [Prevotella sp.]|uniref:hypothetical protein n=1 Tax=Prevotella sp. TaxID=59823 RepID=UPI002F91DAF9